MMGNEVDKVNKQSVEEYIEELIKGGFIDTDGTPLLCACGSDDLDIVNEIYVDFRTCEYDCKCKNCNKIIGHWAYGGWCI